MKVDIKRAARLGGRNFAPGIHDVDDAQFSHWFFQGLMRSGEVVVIDHPSIKKVHAEAPVGSSAEYIASGDEPSIEQPKEVATKSKKKK